MQDSSACFSRKPGEKTDWATQWIYAIRDAIEAGSRMIADVKLCINHSIKVRKLDITNPCVRFKPGYNVLIGRNGSGKSTVLRAIALCPMCIVTRDENDIIKYITTETLNPNVGGTFSTREKMIQGVRAMFVSHGEGVVDSLRNQSHANETVVLIDSPETGQDMESSVEIHQGLLEMTKHYQVIVATNSLVFMRNGNLIDLGNHSLSDLVTATQRIVADLKPY
jgi:ABC-type transport system involved in cytochrome bd biosynthesis fused ATPase/permease subunit